MELKKKVDAFLGHTLAVLETLIAVISTCVLVLLLGFYLCRILRDPNYFLQEQSVQLFLQEVLSIVIGLEFVKLLMHMTPANILEVLIMAIARHIVVGHSSAFDTLLSICCIAVLFLVKRCLISNEELHKELEDEGVCQQRRYVGIRRKSKQTASGTQHEQQKEKA